MLRRLLLISVLAFVSACASSQKETTSQRTSAEISDLYLEMGTSALANGDFPRAIENLRTALKYNNDNKIAHNHLGLAMLNLNERDQAKTYFERALALDPNYSDAAVNLGSWHFSKADYTTAKHYFKKALTNLEYSHRFIPLTNLGHVALVQGELEEAKKSLYEALANNPKYCLAHFFLGTVYQRQDRPEKALAEYKQSVKGTCAANIEGHFQLGVVNTQLKDYKSARSAYQQVIEQAPNSNLAEEASQKLRTIP